MTINNILVAGASVSAGCGLPGGSSNEKLWITQLIKSQYPTSTITNISVIGADNKEIFLAAQSAILQDSYTKLFVCWQSMPRINLNLGLEEYTTSACILSGSSNNIDYKLVANQVVSGNILDKFRQYVLRYYNYHWDIRELVMYVNNLNYLALSKNIDLYFINYQQPWSPQYFDYKQWTAPSELDVFTQDILNSDLRDDAESHRLYNIIHTDYRTIGGIQEKHWLNLYSPLRELQIDTVSATDMHPGIGSQDVFFEFLKSRLQ
jgi:hypothetical protein